jgi:hypothetical protein
VCGSAEAAGEILGWTTREVRRVVKADVEATGVDRQSIVGATPKSTRGTSRPTLNNESGSA